MISINLSIIGCLAILSQAHLILGVTYPYMGCFKDAPVRDMVYQTIVSHNSHTFCAERCAGMGFKYFGVQNGQDCFCGNTYNNNKVWHAKVADGECSKRCTGNQNELCGNVWRQGVFLTSSYQFKHGLLFKGCFVDEPDRDMVDGILSGANSHEFCADRCQRKGYKYFGVQNGQDCWCGNSYGRYQRVPDAECSKPCTGNSGQKCGNVWKQGVYEIGGAEGCGRWEYTCKKTTRTSCREHQCHEVMNEVCGFASSFCPWGLCSTFCKMIPETVCNGACLVWNEVENEVKKLVPCGVNDGDVVSKICVG